MRCRGAVGRSSCWAPPGLGCCCLGGPGATHSCLPSTSLGTRAHACVFAAAIKLLHWSILAYYPETTLRHNRHLSAAAALADLGLQHWEVMDELGADVHCLLGWGGDRVVLAFR